MKFKITSFFENPHVDFIPQYNKSLKISTYSDEFDIQQIPDEHVNLAPGC